MLKTHIGKCMREITELDLSHLLIPACLEPDSALVACFIEATGPILRIGDQRARSLCAMSFSIVSR